MRITSDQIETIKSAYTELYGSAPSAKKMRQVEGMTAQEATIKIAELEAREQHQAAGEDISKRSVKIAIRTQILRERGVEQRDS